MIIWLADFSKHIFDWPKWKVGEGGCHLRKGGTGKGGEGEGGFETVMSLSWHIYKISGLKVNKSKRVLNLNVFSSSRVAFSNPWEIFKLNFVLSLLKNITKCKQLLFQSLSHFPSCFQSLILNIFSNWQKSIFSNF